MLLNRTNLTSKFRKYLLFFSLTFCIFLTNTSNVYAVPATLSTNCGLETPGDTSNSSIFYPDGLTDAVLRSSTGLSSGTDGLFCIYQSPPTTAEADTECVSQGSADNQTNYAILITGTEYCAYQYDINTANADQVTNGAVFVLPVAGPATDPTAIPIFSPIGLFITMLGLLWLGTRRKLSA